MNIDPGMMGDRRTLMLRTLLSCPHAEVYLLRLWCYAAENHTWKWERGTLSNAFLAAVCEYGEDPGELVSALKTSQWLVTHDDGSIELADYARVNRRQIASRRNGQLGGRPRKTQRDPSRNLRKTHGKPRQNPAATREKPTANPGETQREHCGNLAKTDGQPSGNLDETCSEPKIPPIEDSSYPPEDNQTPPLYVSPTETPPEKAASKSGPMKRPTVADVAEYCREKGYDIDPETFVAHYQAKGWRIGKSPMKCWKSAVVTWTRRRKQSGQRADESKSYRV